jgi:hypothetical protein
MDFGKTEIIDDGPGLPEMRRRVGTGWDYSRFNAASENSVRNSAEYVGATAGEIAEILEYYGF